jgi:HD domain-containing protein
VTKGVSVRGAGDESEADDEPVCSCATRARGSAYPGAEPPALTERFLAAVALAQEVHGHVRRSGTEIPYLAHLLVVTGLVIEDGGDEDEAIAAMLHDTVEDGGGRLLLERIHRSFGSGVAAIVEGCSDTVDVDPAEPWIERKRRYLAHLDGVRNDAILRVALADKVHNARSIVRDYREEGHALWERFTQKTARQQLWYYGGLLAFFRARRPGPLTEDLLRAVSELAWLVARDHAQRHKPVSLWVDPDMHQRQAPEGWAQVCTAEDAIALLDEFSVHVISLHGPAEAYAVVHWLIEQDEAGRDRWPVERIAFHGEDAADAIDELIGAIESHSRSRTAKAFASLARP